MSNKFIVGQEVKLEGFDEPHRIDVVIIDVDGTHYHLEGEPKYLYRKEAALSEVENNER